MVNIIKQHVMRLFTPIVKVPLFSFMGGQFVSYYDIGCRIKVIVMVSFPWVLISISIFVYEINYKSYPPKNSKVQYHLEMGEGGVCSQASVNEMFAICSSIKK